MVSDDRKQIYMSYHTEWYLVDHKLCSDKSIMLVSYETMHIEANNKTHNSVHFDMKDLLDLVSHFCFVECYV